MSLDEQIQAEVRALAAAHQLRTPRVVEGRPGPMIVLDGREVLNLSSNDYLALAGDRRTAAAAMAMLEQVGVGAGGSRLITGTQRAHVELEAAVADWMRCGGVRLFNSGYAANTGVLAALLGPDDVVCSDALNHASLIDGCRLSRARVIVYPHRDVAAVAAALATARSARRRIVVTESLFSMDGDRAELTELAAVCKHADAALIVDEAHAVGAYGPEGRGLCALDGVVPDVVIGTFGKALGTFGAFVATTPAIAELLWNRARPFVFSTAMPASIAAASRVAIELVRGEEGAARRRILSGHAKTLRGLLPRAGGWTESAIAPIVIGDERETMGVTDRVLEGRVFVQGIRPPTVALGSSRLRLSLGSGLSTQQVVIAAETINNALRQ